MKRLIKVFALLCLSKILIAAPGCMDNSYRLTEPIDSKDYHIVSCNCPCQRYPIIARKSICSKCRHYRDPRFRAGLIKQGLVNCPATFTNFGCAKHLCTTNATCSRQKIQ